MKKENIGDYKCYKNYNRKWQTKKLGRGVLKCLIRKIKHIHLCGLNRQVKVTK